MVSVTIDGIQDGSSDIQARVGEAATYRFDYTVSNVSNEDDLEGTTRLYAGTTSTGGVASTRDPISGSITSGSNLGIIGYNFDERQEYPHDINITIQVTIEENGRVESDSITQTVTLLPPEDDPGAIQSTADSPIADTFQFRNDFKIVEIEFSSNTNVERFDTYETVSVTGSDRQFFRFEGAEAPTVERGRITFEYPNPAIAIDSGGRFVKHEIIGGPVVRQKVGQEPKQYSIDGICKEDTANAIDELDSVRRGKIIHDRLPENSKAVQFGSASTEPISDGGGADMTDGELLYTFSINCVEAEGPSSENR